MIISALRKNWFSILAVGLLCAIAFFAGWWVNERGGDANERLLVTAYRQVTTQSFFRTQSDQELAYAAIRGMLGAVNDHYAELIEPDAAQNLTATFAGKMGVVGLHAENQNGQVVISMIFPGGSAQAAGLQVGDVIRAIDGTPLDADTDSSETGLLLRGAPGSSVRVTVERGGQTLEFELQRAAQRFVTSKMLPGSVGYITLSAFNETASAQMKTALQELLAQQPVGIIWDLRNNEGGDMQAAQQILSYFIEDGLLFTAELTHGRSVTFRAKGGALVDPNLPLVVLMDKTSYSAAETCAAALEQTGRGLTVGETSYGKGVIQATMPLEEGAMLQITIARWLAPDGAWYHEKGVPAQIAAHDDPATGADETLEKGLEVIVKP